MISKIAPVVEPNLFDIYLAWSDAWLLFDDNSKRNSASYTLSLEDLAMLFEEGSIDRLIHYDQLILAISSFKHHIKLGNISFGGSHPPSCDETNLTSQTYNPQSKCDCETTDITKLKNGLPIDPRDNICEAISGMKSSMEIVIARQNEWHSTGLFTAKKLRHAVEELIHANMDIQTTPDTCRGPRTANSIPDIRAPDRRPNARVDGSATIGNQIYPTHEQIKICADAKYFGVMACGAGLCDEGLARAVADSCNDILIGDYCEAADAAGLLLLQRVGAGAMAFLKLCNLAGRVTDWQFDNLSAYMIQCRVLGHFRDHSRNKLPDGIYGSRMTGLGIHRHIDVAAFHGVMTASLATGQELTENEFMHVVDACVYINDFVDFRGDTMRKQRENVILRGIRGDMCRYLDRMIVQCLDSVIEVIGTSEVGALVVMGYCNWAILGAHHKVFEVLEGIRKVKNDDACIYDSQLDATRYERLLRALQPYGTLGDQGPRVSKKRVEMDKLYNVYRKDPTSHLAWLADATRDLLQPKVLRKIIDVVHYEWSGDLGAVDYCP
ncbi:hypothetical protein N7481_000267 [Penicillium waksmanii]|uniref:uncharacterized protein n=1 Tax=Penicillium waksmanii TaxID=69791 RepID=UPI002549529A|nr:uncharacterized protein N7481_000267 [Penicillium waksmanii]KAJ5999858.1 hypothetical protein N7481_000267 [Penicillium waksmanii]